MKNNNLIQVLTVFVLVAAPFIYVATFWNQLPETVPTHFGIDGTPDAFGSKNKAIFPVFILIIMGLGVYFLIKNLDKIDPKRANQTSKDVFDKIALLLLAFMSGLSIYIFHSIVQHGTGGFLFVLIGLFFAAMGNLMHSLPPNYFVGLRLPWTLQSDDNWRKTHQLAGKIWFVGGIFIALLSSILNTKSAFFFLMGLIAIMVLIPMIYSYSEYRKTRE